jgi:hypothetical protein
MSGSLTLIPLLKALLNKEMVSLNKRALSLFPEIGLKTF